MLTSVKGWNIMALRVRQMVLSCFYSHTRNVGRLSENHHKSTHQSQRSFASYSHWRTVESVSCRCLCKKTPTDNSVSKDFRIGGVRRLSDDVKNDKDVKQWLNEMKDDFEAKRGVTNSDKDKDSVTSDSELSSSSSSDASSSDSESDTDIEKEASKLEKDGGLNETSQTPSSEIEDFTADWIQQEDTESEWKPPVLLERGKTGVFELEDLVKVLEDTKAREICVIRLPEEVKLSDYMVIVSALSTRHMKAIAADVRWIYKQRKNKKDAHLRLEGEDSPDWFALDLGNIILHIFLPQTRELYDLESLWTLGPELDPKSQPQDDDKYVFSVDELPWLADLESITEKYKEQTSRDGKTKI